MSIPSSQMAMRVAETLLMIQDNLKCAVCLEILRNPVNTQCGHTFCQLCINQIVKEKNATCPLCNSRVNRRGVMQNEKLKNIVHALNTMISSAKKDLTDSGIEDVFLLSKPRRPSSKESFSPSKPKAPQPKRHARVTTWLEQQLGPSSPTQESNSSVLEEEPTPLDDSDSEMVSVSQINPDQHNVPSVSHSKPLSAHIEEDGVANESRSKVITLKTKKTGSKTKQKSLKGFNSPAKQISKPGPSSVLFKHSKNITSGPVVVVDPEKENTSNQHPSRSPGWSRVKEMKKEFRPTPNVLRTAYPKGNRSPVPAIEDSGSGEEEPCLNLSLNSPVLKRKAIVDNIVNTLESEIQIFEKSLKPVENKTENKVTLSKLPLVKLNKMHVPLDGHGMSPSKPLVQFFKLGSVVSRKVPSVPIYLKGSLEHLHCIDVSSFAYRLLTDAQTQTEVEATFRTSQCSNATTPVRLNDHSSVSRSQQVIPFQGRKSSEKDSVHAMDMMDAETVVLSLTVPSDIGRSQIFVANSPPLLDEEAAESHCPDNLQSQKSASIICSSEVVEICASPDEPKQSQLSASVIFSQDKETLQKKNNFETMSQKSLQKRNVFETTSHIPQVDLDDSCSSIVNEKKSKRVRALCSSSDSDSDNEMSKERKKHRKHTSSDNEDSGANALHITAGDTMEILANIEAQLEDTGRNSSPEWSNPKRQSVPSCRASPNSETVQVHGDTTITQIDSDEDSEFINPTPQKQPSFTAISATQSDDIVPSSQPPVVLQATVPLLPHWQQDSSVEKCSVSIKNMSELPKAAHNVSGSSVNDIPKEENRPEAFSNKNTEQEEMHDVGEETSASPTGSSVWKPVFVCSSIPQNLAAKIDKLALLVNGEFSSKFTADTTHLIVRVDKDNRADKTFKYLCAVAAGKWVVSYAWVQDCLDAKKLVPEEPFEVLDASGEPGPRRSREARRSHKQLFEGFEFCCVGDFADLSKQQLEELLRQCGASIVPNPTEFSFQDRIIPLTVAQWDDSKEEEYNLWLDRYSTPLVQHDWVLDCIGKFNVTSFSSMLICDATDDVLSSMGFPAYMYEFIDSEQ